MSITVVRNPVILDRENFPGSAYSMLAAALIAQCKFAADIGNFPLTLAVRFTLSQGVLFMPRVVLANSIFLAGAFTQNLSHPVSGSLECM